jgi:membrane protein YqaA with SNARE-associated domain
MCPMCMMRTALLAVAAVSTGGLATYVVARFGNRKQTCDKFETRKERS